MTGSGQSGTDALEGMGALGMQDSSVLSANASSGAAQRFVWMDIEDQASLVYGIDVENFPTLLIGSVRGPQFFGSLTPQPEVLSRMVRAQVVDEGPTLLQDPKLNELLARLRELTAD